MFLVLLCLKLDMVVRACSPRIIRSKNLECQASLGVLTHETLLQNGSCASAAHPSKQQPHHPGSFSSYSLKSLASWEMSGFFLVGLQWQTREWHMQRVNVMEQDSLLEKLLVSCGWLVIQEGQLLLPPWSLLVLLRLLDQPRSSSRQFYKQIWTSVCPSVIYLPFFPLPLPWNFVTACFCLSKRMSRNSKSWGC